MVLLGFSRRVLRHLRLHKVPARFRRPAGSAAHGTCHSHAGSLPGGNSESSWSLFFQIYQCFYLICALCSAASSSHSVFSVCAFVFCLSDFTDHCGGAGGALRSSGFGLRALAGRGAFLGTLQISLLPVDLPTFPAQAPRLFHLSLWDSDLRPAAARSPLSIPSKSQSSTHPEPHGGHEHSQKAGCPPLIAPWVSAKYWVFSIHGFWMDVI